MSDFNADAMARVLVESFGFRCVHGFAVLELRDTVSIERQIADAFRAAEAHALARAAELCDAHAKHWHKDSSTNQQLLACGAAIRALSEPTD